jgi:flagellin
MRINTNLTALNTYTQYTKNQTKVSSAVAKLSSGYAINSAADDAAGLAISEKMRAQIRGLNKASSNAQDAISLVQTAEGSLDSSTQILQRMRELAVQSSSDTNNNAIDRTSLQDEFSQLQTEINDISSKSTYNKKNLLDGSLSSQTKSVSNQTLANTGMTVSVGNASAGAYNFSVTTKQETAAVTGVKPTSADVTVDSDGYFTSASTASVDSNAKASAQLNGNYTITASYSSDNHTMTVNAKGDNNQTFTATLSSDTLGALTSSKSLSINFQSDATNSSNDGFTLNMTLKNTTSNSPENYTTLASEISKAAASVSGGVTEKAATYGSYANLTGSTSVKLLSGQSAVTFDNGVTVHFSQLTSGDVSTTNKGTADITGYSVVNPSANNAKAAFGTGTVGGKTVSAATMTLSDPNDVIADGNYSITSDATGKLTLTDADGNAYTAATQTVANGAGSTAADYAYTFTSTTDSSKTFTGKLNLTLGANVGATSAIAFSGTMTGTAGYAMATVAGGGTATLSNIALADDSTLADGALSISSKEDDTTGYTTFTASDGKGNAYAASVKTSALTASANDGSATNKLTFIAKNGGAAGFTADLTTVKSAAAAVKFATTDTPQITTNITGAGHNYATVFGNASDGLNIAKTNLDASTAFDGATSSAGVSGTWSGFSTSSTGVAAGKMTITAANTTNLPGGAVTFYATDSAGKTYKTDGTALSSDVLSTTANGTKTNALVFTDTSDSSNTFTMTLDTKNNGNTDNFINSDTTGTMINVQKNLTASTTSNFDVDAKTNAGLTFQVGANEGDTMTINIDKMDSDYLGVSSASVATQAQAEEAVTSVDNAINQVSSQRAYLGAVQNRLTYKIDNLGTSSENLTSAESQIRDVDMAKEMTEFTNANILSQASTAMLAQANSLPQNVLSLIKG